MLTALPYGPRAALVACLVFGHAGADDAPASPTGIARWFDPQAAPFIPIPEIDTAPHSGLTLGLIPTTLRLNEAGEIDRIVAPDVIHSQYFGWGARMRVFGYPSADTEWSVVGGLKQRTEREFDARYAVGETRQGRYTWSAEAIYDRSGIPRFFGFGNESRKADETSYVNNQERLDATVGWNISRELQMSYAARLRHVTVQPSVLPQLVSIQVRFPSVAGLQPTSELQQRVALSYDTRDARTIPGDGGLYVLYAAVVARSIGSSYAATSVGGDARQYWALAPTVTLAAHGSLRYTPGSGPVPFWALPSLGGDRSVLAEREPLRGYGEDRFIDRNQFASGIELRTRVVDFQALDTRLSIEVAPFLDVGKVFAKVAQSPLSRLHAAGGLGIRGIASPFVVGYVDLGYGREKLAVFSGINYPF